MVMLLLYAAHSAATNIQSEGAPPEKQIVERAESE
jgi:hypothetical protein